MSVSWKDSGKKNLNQNQVANAEIHQKADAWYSEKQLRYCFCSLQPPSTCFPRGAAAAAHQWNSPIHCLLEKPWYYKMSYTSCDFTAFSTYKTSSALICSPYPQETWIYWIFPWICCGIIVPVSNVTVTLLLSGYGMNPFPVSCKEDESISTCGEVPRLSRECWKLYTEPHPSADCSVCWIFCSIDNTPKVPSFDSFLRKFTCILALESVLAATNNICIFTSITTLPFWCMVSRLQLVALFLSC